jgi:hypothetical protein
MDGFKTISEVVEGLRPGTTGTALQKRSTDSLDLMTLPDRLDDTMLARVEAIAAAPLPALQSCDEVHFGRTLRAMASALPRRASDEVSGELMLKVYQGRLGGYSRQAMTYLFNHAIDTCRWFPTVAECLEILSRWERSDEHSRRRDLARRAVANEKETRLREALMTLAAREMPQEQIDCLPEYWRKIAEERGYLKRADGKFVIRHEPA